ncbi:MAG TPA: GGDEF domain-containing protein [Pseudoxanthomonas sp.]|nr:GGDEF domain-containing protein [Pseudoxanthomonas sp.]
MTTDFYNLLLSDCGLAVVLLLLFWYVQRISRGLRGIALWGVAHLVYSLGAAMLDGTTQELERSGEWHSAYWTAGIGGLLACAGLVGLAWSIIQFVGQRALHRVEWLLMPLCLALSLAGWWFLGTVDAQGAAMSATEVLVLLVLIAKLRHLNIAPDHLPARLMMLGCAVLLVLYGRDLLDAFTGEYGPNDAWVNLDISIWFLLNFCMLMLTSFHAGESLRLSALFDPLTGALNRRGLNSELRTHEESMPSGGELAVIVLDLDDFKAVNDLHGHQTGDEVLQGFSDAVHGCIRDGDLFARIGGEEFVVVLTDSSAEIAQQMAERIRSEVAALEFATSRDSRVRVTVSAGVGASLEPQSFPALMRTADQALYEAKRLGRNQVQVRWLQA